MIAHKIKLLDGEELLWGVAKQYPAYRPGIEVPQFTIHGLVDINKDNLSIINDHPHMAYLLKTNMRILFSCRNQNKTIVDLHYPISMVGIKNGIQSNINIDRELPIGATSMACILSSVIRKKYNISGVIFGGKYSKLPEEITNEIWSLADAVEIGRTIKFLTPVVIITDYRYFFLASFKKLLSHSVNKPRDVWFSGACVKEG